MTETTTAIEQAKPQSKAAAIRNQLNQSADQFGRALAGRIDPEEFTRICLTTFRKGGARMSEVEPASFLAAAMEAAQVGLRPEGVLGECYIIPRKDRRSGLTFANFQIGYQGALKLALRNPNVEKIEPRVVFEGERFRVEYGTEPHIEHVPAFGEKLRDRHIIAAYAVATLKSGKTQFEVVDRDELDRVAASSGHPGNQTPSDVWKAHPIAMAKKTAILRLCKYLPNPDHEAKRALQVGSADLDAVDLGDAITVEQVEEAEEGAA